MATRRKYSKKAYNEFVRQLDLSNIWMDELELVRPAVSESDGIELSITVEGKWDVHEHDFDVYIRLTIRFMAEGADEETAPLEEDALRLTIVYAVTYHSEGGNPI